VTDVGQLKEAARELWSRGDYVRIAERIEPVAREVVDACAISAGQEVLDVAAGNGNLAVVAAREGAAVVASDLTPAMVELGRMRTETEGLEVDWVVADAEELPFEDGRFDCAASVFGAMFAPRPEVAAREMFRVVRPGGTVGLANWTPEGFIGRWFGFRQRYGPPLPPDVPPPLEWGREDVVRERFDGLAASVSVERCLLRWSFESPDAALKFYGETAGPGLALMEALDDEGRARLRDDFHSLVADFNQATDGSVEVDGEYLLVVARRRG
jgi:ubiquinone/menaquinone biosynthesis C-methylase UbiE